jgi:uncharacterized membrane protein YfcA
MVFETSYIWVALMGFVAHFIQGCTGFGGTVIASPVVTGLLGADVGVCFGTLITLPMLYILGFRYFRDVAWKELGKIIVLMAPGMIVGNIIFSRISAEQAKFTIGFIVTAIALKNIYNAFIRDPRLQKNGTAKASEATADNKAIVVMRYAALLLGGCVHGAFNIGGPLVTVYTIYSVKDKTAFRATMTWVWIIMNTFFNAFSQLLAGRYATPVLWSALAISFPLAAIGFYLGHVFSGKINREVFLKIVYVCLLIVGGDMFVRAALVLL